MVYSQRDQGREASQIASEGKSSQTAVDVSRWCGSVLCTGMSLALTFVIERDYTHQKEAADCDVHSMRGPGSRHDLATACFASPAQVKLTVMAGWRHSASTFHY